MKNKIYFNSSSNIGDDTKELFFKIKKESKRIGYYDLPRGATLKTLNPPISLNKTLSNHLRMPHKLIPSLIPSTFS
jgi:hypothetical protein